MTKAGIKREMRRITDELARLQELDEIYNPGWKFWGTAWESKRRMRLNKTYWALKRRLVA